MHTIAITNQANSGVDGLGAATGGLTFIHSDNEAGNDLADAVLDIANYDQSKICGKFGDIFKVPE